MTETVVAAVCAPAVAVTVTEYVPAGVPVAGAVPPPPLPPQAASSARPTVGAAALRMRRARRAVFSKKTPPTRMNVKASDAG
jgi:hypothetical protein